jgi:hypothetical protein
VGWRNFFSPVVPLCQIFGCGGKWFLVWEKLENTNRGMSVADFYTHPFFGMPIVGMYLPYHAYR